MKYPTHSITTLDDLSLADYIPEYYFMLCEIVVRVAMEAATLEYFGMSPYEIYDLPTDY